MNQRAFQNVLGTVVETQIRKTQSARANARVFGQFASIASVATESNAQPTPRDGDDRRRLGEAMLEYVHEDFPECESHKEVECRSVLTVSSLKAAIKQGASLHELKALRRQFARDRHPDLVPVNERASATRDMTLVNAMIDRAILDAER